MTAVAKLFTDVQDAVVAALAGVSITCYPYESQLIGQVPCATLSFLPPHGGVGVGVYDNDTYRIGELTWTFRYYVDLEEGEAVAQLNMQTGLAAIYGALGADRSLSGSVRYSHMDDGNIQIIATGGVTTPARAELMFEAPLRVTPHPV